MAVPRSDWHEHCLRSLEGHAEPREELIHRPVVRNKEPLAIEGQREVAVTPPASAAPRPPAPSRRGRGKRVPRTPPHPGPVPAPPNALPPPARRARGGRHPQA